MQEIINSINEIIKEEKMTRKGIYENLLVKGTIKPNSQKLVNEAIEYGLEYGLISQNKIKTFHKKRGKIPEVYTTEQLIKLFDTVDQPKLAICLWLGFFCGLRIREVCNLKVIDIDLQNKIISVKNSKNTNRSKDGYGKDRNITIPDIAINPLKKWLDIISGGEWLIPSMQDSNRPIRTKTIHEQFRFLLKKCDLSQEDYTVPYTARNHGKKKNMNKNIYKFRFHTLRHTYATYLLDKGVPLENIQRSLGHSEIETTLVYAKVRDTKTKQFINTAFNMPMKIVNNESTINNYRPEETNRKQDNNISPETILKQRLVRGEIDILTYKKLLAEISPENTINVIYQNKGF